MQPDYGKIKLTCVENGYEFWALVDEMLNDDNPSPMSNRAIFADAFRCGNVYTMTVEETDSMYERGARRDNIFIDLSSGTRYMFPCAAIMDNSHRVMEWLWVAPRARRLGLGKKLVELLKPTSTSKQLNDSKKFWEAVKLAEK